jgi:hypothetical protein
MPRRISLSHFPVNSREIDFPASREKRREARELYFNKQKLTFLEQFSINRLNIKHLFFKYNANYIWG